MRDWVTVDRGQGLLLPPSIDELLPDDHLARFVVEIVEGLDLSRIMASYERRGRGSATYHPSMLTALLFYGYATGTMSSRRIERACRYDIAFRYIAAGAVPDHDTIASFRRRHLSALSALFVRVLLIAREMGVLKVGTVAIDGTKVRANASKHAAVSFERAQKLELQLRAEVARLMRMAEGADNTPLAEGVDLPAEIARRQERIGRLREAQVAIARRHGDAALEDYAQRVEESIGRMEEAAREGKPVPEPAEPPDLEPPDKAQHNFTDPDSRIMPDKGSFSQSYTAQAAVDTGTMLIVGQRIAQSPGDKRELLATLDAIDPQVGTASDVLADAGYFSAANVRGVEERGARAWIAPGRERHHESLDDRLAPPPGPTGLDDAATPTDRMRRRLRTAQGRAQYRLRKMTVEPAFGIVKSAMGFRQFLLRGVEKVRNEWALVCLGYNLRRLWTLKTAT